MRIGVKIREVALIHDVLREPRTLRIDDSIVAAMARAIVELRL